MRQKENEKPTGVWVLWRYFFPHKASDDEPVNPTILGQSRYKTGLHLKGQDYVDSRGLEDIQEERDPKTGEVLIGGQGGRGMIVLLLKFKKFISGEK